MVILVDDESTVRAGIAQTLELEGYRVIACSSAEQAIPKIARDLRGIIVTDIRLGGQSGLELLAYVMKLDATIPVILITGQGDIQMAVDSMRWIRASDRASGKSIQLAK